MKTIETTILNTLCSDCLFSQTTQKSFYVYTYITQNGNFSEYKPNLDDLLLYKGKVKIAYEVKRNFNGMIENIVKKIQCAEKDSPPWNINQQTKEETIMSKVTVKENEKSTVVNTKPNNFFKLSGVVYYAHIREPNTKGDYPSGKYQLDLSITDDLMKKLIKLGVQIKTNKNHPEMGNFVRLKATKQPRVINEDGLELVDIPLIGNGTTADVSVGMYPNREANVKAGKGGKNCLGVFEINITNFVPYGKELQSLSDIDDSTLGIEE